MTRNLHAGRLIKPVGIHLAPKISVQRRGMIFQGSPGSVRASCCFPSLARLNNGELLASWRSGTEKDSDDGNILLSRSQDEGQSWSQPVAPFDTRWQGQHGDLHYGPLTVLPGGNVLCALMWVDRSVPNKPFFHPESEGLLPVRTLFYRSTDHGRHWTFHGVLDEAPYHSPMPLTGPAIALSDQSIGCPFEVNKAYEDTRPWRHAAAIKWSNDGGMSWPEHVEVANDDTDRLMYWDSHYAIRETGMSVAAFWTYDRKHDRDTHIHLSESGDRGHSWSKPRDTGIKGQVAHPIWMKDDRLMLVYVDRFDRPSIRVAVSEDLGKSFNDKITIYQHNNTQIDPGNNANSTDYLQDMEQWTFGRIDGFADNNNHIWLTYYAGTSQATNIHWCQLSY